MPEPHPRHAPCNPCRLERVVPRRFACLYVAEPASPGARVAEDHERGGPSLPALADVRAGGLLAHGVEVLRFDQSLELAVARAARRGNLEPRRLAATVRLHVGPKDLEHVRSTGVCPRPRHVKPFAHKLRLLRYEVATPRVTQGTLLSPPWVH